MFTNRKLPYEEITPKEAQKRLGTPPGLFVLDVREAEEFRAGHIDGAVLLPLGQLALHGAALPKDRPILCVCHSGSRSSIAASRLAAVGFTTINLRGGMFAWERERLPVTRGAS